MNFEDELCGCGCWKSEHDSSGRCLYCLECEGFTYDEDATVIAYATMKDEYPPEAFMEISDKENVQ